MNCSSCGDLGRGRRFGLPCCKDCLRLTKFKWESGVDELRRINRSAREEQKAAPKAIRKGSWN